MTAIEQREPGPPPVEPRPTLEDIVGVLCHDLRAPVRHIRGFVEILVAHLGDQLDETGEEYIAQLKRAAATMQAQVSALERYSHTSSASLNLAPVDSGEALQDALVMLQSAVDLAEPRILIGELPTLVFDREALVNVFFELVGNSIQFGGRDTTVEISAYRTESDQTLVVRDDGPGLRSVDGPEATRLFRRFHPPTVSGAGVGLAIVELLVHRHGGTVGIETDEDSGMSVAVTVPLRPLR